MSHDRGHGTMAAEAELFFMQIGLGDSRERERLLTLSHETATAPCLVAPPVVVVRTTDSTGVLSSR